MAYSKFRISVCLPDELKPLVDQEVKLEGGEISTFVRRIIVEEIRRRQRERARAGVKNVQG